MNKKCYLLTVFSYVCSLLSLTNCSTVPQQQTTQISHNVPFVEQADAYLAKAKSAALEEKNELKIKAAGRLIYDRQIQDGVAILKNLSINHPEQADEKNVLMAKANMMVNNPKQASLYLAQVHNSNQLSPFYQNLYRRLLIDSYERKGRSIEAVEERIKLNDHLQQTDARIANNMRIWMDLIHMPQAELQTLAIEANDPIVQGWASLAAIAQQLNSISSIHKWQTSYPAHQANQLIYATRQHLLPRTGAKNIALLLPMTGSLSGPGQAIKDGFLDAKNQYPKSISVKTYDVAKGSVLALYHKAIEDGADMVIGPLSKNQVDIIASQSHPVPTLLLNYASSSVSANAWEFGLSPSYEALQLADKLTEQGFKHAILITSQGEWGDQVKSAFNRKWLQNGNRIVDELAVAKDTHYNEAVRRLLHIDSSAQREKSLKQLLGRDVKGNLRRREDFDVVVLMTHPSKARQIVPLLKYYYIGETPIYGISTIHSADLRVADNRDLDGVVFSDVAYIYQQDKLIPRRWPEKLNSYNRLFAIGRDSFLISQKLEKIVQFPAINLQDGDDTVYLSTPTQITYQSNWGQMVEGKAQRIS
ncbi:penicillin-binding protein activator [Legionella sp. W05-934-2]|jgi:outer membrane PBP1 activator LpoA protein|uniref:penicillin-binding protein activator n=1 Tax=Legionella sp. W05-934-2 TaxID=1198649 RepID=UPI003462FB16